MTRTVRHFQISDHDLKKIWVYIKNFKKIMINKHNLNKKKKKKGQQNRDRQFGDFTESITGVVMFYSESDAQTYRVEEL